MKCIHYYVTRNVGYTARVTHDVAVREVAKGIAMYCPKSWWKRQQKVEPLNLT